MKQKNDVGRNDILNGVGQRPPSMYQLGEVVKKIAEKQKMMADEGAFRF